ncbi:MAG TPA: histidine kinase [Desulfobacterales bacterium]|nr:histidine kinase [Desulfobacterales bacterium]
MLSQSTVALAAFGYLLFLFALAFYGDRRRSQGRSLIANPYIYTLSLAVYCTSWTFYGSVGKAATQGMVFLSTYLGPTLGAFAWWFVVRKILRVCKENNLTTLSDFLALRFGKSSFLGALATVGMLLAIIPYIGLQLKSVSDTFTILVHRNVAVLGRANIFQDTAFYVALILVIFGILFGARHLDPTERHEGMVAAVAFESLVKLLAFLSIGVLVSWVLFSGWGDLFGRISRHQDFSRLPYLNTNPLNTFMLFLVESLLAMGAIILLPRQFHMTVVENTEERHLLTAMWLLPLYFFLINLFVAPIAFGGLLLGLPQMQADTFVLRLPLEHGYPFLALLAFLGGLSASTAMVAVASITVSTMLLNTLIMPLALRLRLADHLSPHLLLIKRLGILIVILLGYASYRLIGVSMMLVDMGHIAFCGVVQLAPAVLGALYWREANKNGALAGISIGFALWAYTLVLPPMVESGWLPTSILTSGPWGFPWLKPTSLFGLIGLDNLSHAFFWSMTGNILVFVCVSLLTRPDSEEEEQSGRFVDIFIGEAGRRREKRFTYLPSLDQLTQFMAKFINPQKAAEARQQFLDENKNREEEWGDQEKMQLAEFVERTIAGSIGPAAARIIMDGYLSSVGSRMEEVFDLFGRVTSSLEESQEQLKRRVAELSVLYEAARKLTSSLYMPELMEGVLDLLVNRLGVERCAVRLLDGDGFLRIKSSRNLSPMAMEISIKPDMRPLLGQCLLTPQVISVADSSIVWDRLQGLYEEEPMASFVMAPIATETVSLGVLTAASNQKGFFAKEHVEFFQSLAGQLGLAVRSAQMVAHHIRNPLVAIGGFAHRLAKKLPPGSITQKYAEIIIKEAERLEKMVGDIVETTVVAIPREEESDINQVVRGALGIMKEAFEKKQIKLRVNLADGLSPLTMDVGNLKRALLQLIANALEALPSGGSLEVVTAQSPDGYVQIQIIDNGKGIPAAILPHIFDAFFSTKPAGPGLGLPIVHKIISQHGGQVSIASEENVGTTATVKLPIAKYA